MLVAGIYTITQNPSVFVTGCLHGIRKNIFMFTLSEPSAFRIRCTFLDRFFFFSIRAATTGGGIFGTFLLSFRCSFSMRFLVFIDFSTALRRTVLPHLQSVSASFAVCPCLHGCNHEDSEGSISLYL